MTALVYVQVQSERSVQVVGVNVGDIPIQVDSIANACIHPSSHSPRGERRRLIKHNPEQLIEIIIHPSAAEVAVRVVRDKVSASVHVVCAGAAAKPSSGWDDAVADVVNGRNAGRGCDGGSDGLVEDAGCTARPWFTRVRLNA